MRSRFSSRASRSRSALTAPFIFLKPGQIIVNKELYELEEGDIVIIEKNEKHKIMAKTDMDIIGIKNPNINDKQIVDNETN